MKTVSLLCLASLSLMIPTCLDADDSLRIIQHGVPTSLRTPQHGVPTLAYYTKGRVIYYGYTDPGYGYANHAYSYANRGYGYANHGYGHANPDYGYNDPGDGYTERGNGYTNLDNGYANLGYGYTNPGQWWYPYSSFRSHITSPMQIAALAPTMAYYANKRVIYYEFASPAPAQYALAYDWRDSLGASRYPGYTSAAYYPSTQVQIERNEGPTTAPQGSQVRMHESNMMSRDRFEEEVGQPKRSPEEIQEALRSYPVDAAGFYNRGNAWKESFDYDQAIRDYSEAIRLDPEYAVAYYKRGLCYSAIGRMDLAAENIHQANLIKPVQDRPWNIPPRTWFPQFGY